MSERALTLVGVWAFSLALGIALVTVPLLALDVGYDPAAVGGLVAVSALFQFGTRLALPALLGRFADRSLIVISGGLFALACLVLIGATTLPVFVIAQALIGTSRALFWTSSQTHAVRTGDRPVQRLVDLNIVGNAGTLMGPVIGGVLATIDFRLAFFAAVASAALSGLVALGLQRFPPYDRRRSEGSLRLLRRPGVDHGAWSSFIGGGWWALLGSLVPVLLVGAGLRPAGVGLVTTLAEGAGMVALLLIRARRPRRILGIVRTGNWVVLAAIVGLAVAPSEPLVLSLLLMVGGAGGGAITTLGPALADQAAAADEQGDVLAMTGTFRAGALLAVPATAAVLLSVVAIPVALVALAIGMAVPTAIIDRRSPGSPPARR